MNIVNREDLNDRAKNRAKKHEFDSIENGIDNEIEYGIDNDEEPLKFVDFSAN